LLKSMEITFLGITVAVEVADGLAVLEAVGVMLLVGEGDDVDDGNKVGGIEAVGKGGLVGESRKVGDCVGIRLMPHADIPTLNDVKPLKLIKSRLEIRTRYESIGVFHVISIK